MRTLLGRLLRDEGGTNLIEYALLAGTVGLGGAVALSLWPAVMATVYGNWNQDTQDIWEPLDP